MKKSLFLTIALSSACLYASEIMYTNSVKSLSESYNGKVKGRLLPTSKVKILEKKDNKVKVEIEGFMKSGVSNAVYFAKGKRILVAGLSKNSKFVFKVISKMKDENEVEWQKVKFVAYTNDSKFTKDLGALYKQAQMIFNENCSMCHPAHPAHEFTANQWPSVVKAMVTRTAMSKEQNYLVNQYLQKHAKDMKEGK